MKTSDYYYEIAQQAKQIADAWEADTREAVPCGSDHEVVVAVKEDAELAARHSAFREELGQLWSISAFDADTAAFMGEIIEASNASFLPRVEVSNPRNALREGAAITIEHDIREGAFDMLKKRLIDSGEDLRRTVKY